MKLQQSKLLTLATVLTLIAASANAEAIFQGTPAYDGTHFILKNGATDSKDGVNVDTAGNGNEWNEFLMSVPDEVRLEPGKRYRFSFDYIINRIGEDKTRFYQLLRSGEDRDTQRFFGSEWTAKPGDKGNKKITATVIAPSSSLIFGVHYDGAITITNIKVEEAPPITNKSGFLFSGEMKDGEGITLGPLGKIDGRGASIDTMSSVEDWQAKPVWNVLVQTIPQEVVFEPGKKYRISYDYSVQDSGVPYAFYHSFEGGSEDGKSDKLYQTWDGPVGMNGRNEFTVIAKNPGAKVIVGVKKGAIRIENLEIEKVNTK